MSEEDKNSLIAQQIESLIMQTSDPTDKGMLLVLSKIASSLDENTRLTRKFTADFAEHEKTEMALINQGRGMVRVAIFALACFQGMFAYVGNKHIDQMDKLALEVQEHGRELAVVKQYHKAEESERARLK